MRSERRWLELLRSQGLGVACGLGTVVLLAAGTFVLDATRDGASAGIAMDDLRPFVARPSPVHAWMYLLALVLALYAVNTLLATWDSVARKVRSGVRSPAAYAPAVIHVGFVVALAAHLVGGLWGADRGTVLLAAGAGWQPLADGREARLLALEVETLPGGMPKAVRAPIEVRDGAGRVERAEVGYNAPLSAQLATDLHLVGDMGQVRVADLSVAGVRCTAIEGDDCDAAGVRLELAGVAPAGALGPEPLAHVFAAGSERWIAPGRDVPLADGRPLRLEGIREAPALVLRSRRAPGNPLALAAALLVALGLGMMARRFVPQKAREGSEEVGATEAERAA
jgi:hypothetical protein